VNGVTQLSCTISNGGSISCETTGSIAVSATDVIDIQVNAGATAAANQTWKAYVVLSQ
jgi:hypothetical protein